MTYYIPISPIKRKIDFVNLAEKISINGFGDRVEYHRGGWEDHSISTVSPHLKFEYEDDAIAFSLAYGGVVQRDVPIVKGD